MKGVGTIKLAEAARSIGCHVETLRVRVRDGRLRAVRGAHGAFYVDLRDIAALPKPRRGWPEPREVPPASSKGLGIWWRERSAGRAPGGTESWTLSLRCEPTRTRIGAYIVWFRSTAFAGSV